MKKRKNKPAAIKLIRAQGEQIRRESAEKWLKRKGAKVEEKTI